jgi:hypothetical protein
MDNKFIKIGIQIVLVAFAIFLAYKLYSGIMEPIEFNKEKGKRFKATINNLKDIRKIQASYKDVKGDYADSFGKLINFVKTGEFPVVRNIGTVPEELIDSMGFQEAELFALEQELIRRDTSMIPVLDSLFPINYNIDSLRYVPYAENKIEFKIAAGKFKTMSGVIVPVFEASVTNDILLHGLNKQLLINLNDEKLQMNHFPGLKVGDVNSANNNAGNWE